ncbi:MAG TPA: carbon-nitrogen hydrolase family protein [Candidatus Eisenbergiella merdavium]|uniref:Carbon-nitrogen hydrolase family protein n=1 Tax=Candidatus Eisenbergiella merdavium TaxID=2838551 RepID=A0A9D2SQB5_9FIRM|nr:carbon-nitrogen hydrolase family protein [Candidatus Eisenbergiella merdavium]
MKIALASAPVMEKAIGQNVRVILQNMEQCRGKADLVVFGESVLQGFNSLSWEYETDCRMAVPRTDETIMQVRRSAVENRIAVSFGYLEKDGESIFSSQIVIDEMGEVIHNFHRVSIGWKDYCRTDEHYREGEHFQVFSYKGKQFAIGLCGDLWTDGRPEEMRRLKADIILWPVWCDYDAEEWNKKIKYEYARQAALCGKTVLLVNPFDVCDGMIEHAAGGAIYFKEGSIAAENPAGDSGIIIIEV